MQSASVKCCEHSLSGIYSLNKTLVVVSDVLYLFSIPKYFALNSIVCSASSTTDSYLKYAYPKYEAS